MLHFQIDFGSAFCNNVLLWLLTFKVVKSSQLGDIPIKHFMNCEDRRNILINRYQKMPNLVSFSVGPNKRNISLI